MEDYYIIYLDRKEDSSLEVKVDKDDFEKIMCHPYKWYANWNKWTRTYYAKTTIVVDRVNGRNKYSTTYMQLFIMDNSDGSKVDHRSHDTLDNRKSNLRMTSVSENSKHRNGCNKNNKSGYRNVCWSKRDNRWLVKLQVDGKEKTLGRFKKDEIHEAGAFAEEMRIKYYGKYKGKSKRTNYQL